MSLKIIQTDQVRCAPDWSWESCRNGWTGYHLWHVTGGQAVIRKGDKTYSLEPGDCFCFDLMDNHLCSHQPDNPLCLDTVYFHASQPMQPVIFHSRANTALCAALHQCVKLHQIGNTQQALLWLAAAVSEFTDTIEETSGSRHNLIADLTAWIAANYDQPLSLKSLCKMSGYSKNHIIRLFRQQTGLTPYQYYLKCRINKSLSLLLYTNDSITDIAAAVGFEDVAHYSRLFKSITGYSPRQMRERGE